MDNKPENEQPKPEHAQLAEKPAPKPEDFRPWETGKSAVGDPAGRDQGA